MPAGEPRNSLSGTFCRTAQQLKLNLSANLADGSRIAGVTPYIIEVPAGLLNPAARFALAAVRTPAGSALTGAP